MAINRFISKSLFTLALTPMLFSTLPAFAAESSPVDNASYSADRTMETEEITIQNKVFHAPGKERSEGTMGGNKQISILRMDKKKVYILMPEHKMFMEHDLKDQDPNNPEKDMKIERTEVGKETMNGLACTKYKVIATRKDGNKLGGFMWVSAEGVPVKQDLLALEKGKKYRFKVELKNIKVGKQKDELFALPEGYSPMPSFGGMMKGMFGGKK